MDVNCLRSGGVLMAGKHRKDEKKNLKTTWLNTEKRDVCVLPAKMETFGESA